MRYNNLNSLLSGSRSSRAYFLSLPVSLQIELHKYGDYIETAVDLHESAAQMSNIMRIDNL